ncbi:MAG: TolC family protein [Kofleriaceae bacterium]|nr:TolC family protein [Kofleriaceae bacterium]
MKLRPVVLAALLASPSLALAQPGAVPTPPPPPQNPAPAAPAAGARVLSMAEAVDIALRQQPSLRQSRAQLEASKGRIDQVRASQKPNVTLSASASVGGGGSQRDFIDPSWNSAIGASASWRITDFGQTGAQLRAARASSEASAAGVNTTTLDVRYGVESSYLEAVARARLVTVAEATVKSEEAHLDQAKRFVAAQAKDPIEVVQAQARAANARAALAQAQSQAAIAVANLRASIGWVDPTQQIAVAATWPEPPSEPPPALPSLVESARSHRPEIIELDKQVAAADANIDAARAERRPVLSANAQTQWSPGTNDINPQPAWSAGLSLSWQLFDGGRSAADVRVARANRESALAQRDQLLLDLTSQLDGNRAQIDANREATSSSNEAVLAARAQLKLAEARYAQGLGSQIELADAQTAVTTAEGNLIQSEFQLATAWAALNRSLGGL